MSTNPIANEVEIEAEIEAVIADDEANLDELEELLANEQEIPQEFEPVEDIEDAQIIEDIVETAGAEETKSAKKKESKPRLSTAGMKPSDALKARFGDKIYELAVLEIADSELSEEDLKARVDDNLVDFDSCAKKVGEKIVNAFQKIAGNASLSNYTQIAIDLMKDKETVTSNDIRQAYLNSYKVGTANAQSSQMMKLLPALKLATRQGNSLTLNPESALFELISA